MLEEIVHKIPHPHGDTAKPLRALIFDSVYDAYKGVIVYVRIMEGTVKSGDEIKMMATGKTFEVVEVGYLKANGTVSSDTLEAGEVGFIAA